MKLGTEDKKKLILAGVGGVLALGSLIYTLSGTFGGSDSSAPAPVVAVSTHATGPAATATARVESSKLDPTLHPEAMLLTESLVYAGNGRNIFLAGSVPVEAAVKIPKPVASPRYAAAQQGPVGPPPPPPIELRFFGTAVGHDGKWRAFLLHGEDVFVASPGEVVDRRYKVGAITSLNVEITDLTNNNTQRLPMSMQ